MYTFTLNRKNYIININKAVKLAEGNEGIIYDLQNQLLMKIYKKDDQEKRNKVYSMVEYLMYHPKSVVLKYSAWPIAIVYDEHHKQVGYIMKNFKGKKLDTLGGLNRAQKTYPKFKTLDLFDTAIHLIDALYEMRKEIPTLVIGDFSAMNVLVNDQKEICFIDMDSINFNGYRCVVATPGYKAYETLISNPRYLTFTSKTDDFLVGIITFSLISGYHPYTNNAGKSLDSCIKSNMCALFNDYHQRYKPQLDIDYKDLFNQEALDVYKRFFVDGCSQPSKRPALIELRQALLNNQASLKQCKRIKKHQYISSRCPYCKHKRKYKSKPKVKLTKGSIQFTDINRFTRVINSSKVYAYLLSFVALFLLTGYIYDGIYWGILFIPIIMLVYWVITSDSIYSFFSAIGYSFLSFWCVGLTFEVLTWFFGLFIV